MAQPMPMLCVRISVTPLVPVEALHGSEAGNAFSKNWRGAFAGGACMEDVESTC